MVRTYIKKIHLRLPLCVWWICDMWLTYYCFLSNSGRCVACNKNVRKKIAAILREFLQELYTPVIKTRTYCKTAVCQFRTAKCTTWSISQNICFFLHRYEMAGKWLNKCEVMCHCRPWESWDMLKQIQGLWAKQPVSKERLEKWTREQSSSKTHRVGVESDLDTEVFAIA